MPPSYQDAINNSNAGHSTPTDSAAPPVADHVTVDTAVGQAASEGPTVWSQHSATEPMSVSADHSVSFINMFKMIFSSTITSGMVRIVILAVIAILADEDVAAVVGAAEVALLITVRLTRYPIMQIDPIQLRMFKI